jgi:hypothetical protein
VRGVVVAYFEIISRHLRGGNGRINKEPQSVYSDSEMRFETATFGTEIEVPSCAEVSHHDDVYSSVGKASHFLKLED